MIYMFLMIPSAIHDVYDIYIYIQPNFSPTCRSSKDALIPCAFDLSKVGGTCFLRAPDEATHRVASYFLFCGELITSLFEQLNKKR